MASFAPGTRVRATRKPVEGEPIEGTVCVPGVDELGRLHLILDDDMPHWVGLHAYDVEVIAPLQPALESIVLDSFMGRAWQRHKEGWRAVNYNTRSWADLNAGFGPLRLLHDASFPPTAAVLTASAAREGAVRIGPDGNPQHDDVKGATAWMDRTRDLVEQCRIGHAIYGVCELPYRHAGPHSRVPGGSIEANEWEDAEPRCTDCGHGWDWHATFARDSSHPLGGCDRCRCTEPRTVPSEDPLECCMHCEDGHGAETRSAMGDGNTHLAGCRKCGPGE